MVLCGFFSMLFWSSKVKSQVTISRFVSINLFQIYLIVFCADKIWKTGEFLVEVADTGDFTKFLTLLSLLSTATASSDTRRQSLYREEALVSC